MHAEITINKEDKDEKGREEYSRGAQSKIG